MRLENDSRVHGAVTMINRFTNLIVKPVKYITNTLYDTLMHTGHFFAPNTFSEGRVCLHSATVLKLPPRVLAIIDWMTFV